MTYGNAFLRDGERIGCVERFPPTDQFFIHNCSTNLLKHVLAPCPRPQPAGGVNVPGAPTLVRPWLNKQIWAWSHVRRARKLKSRKLLLEAPPATPRKFTSANIFRCTVFNIPFSQVDHSSSRSKSYF